MTSVREATFDLFRARGLKVYATLAYSPAWATDGPELTGVPRNPDDWVTFCYQAAKRYRKTITMGGKPYGVETTTQTIGAHETRSLFGCDVEIVHIHRESDTKTQNQSVSGYGAVVDEDYAPALGIDVHFVNNFHSPTLELRTESTLESVSTK